MGQPPYNQQRGNMNGSMNADALAELGLFSAGILHEVKNSLQSVGNALFLLENERDLAPKVRQEVAIARRELSRAFDVSAQTLALVRQESPVAMSVNDVVDEVLERYSGKIAYKHVAIERQYKFTGSILSNPGAVRQVFANIVLNALESAPRNKGKLVIRTSACCNSNAASGVQIDFADNGRRTPEYLRINPNGHVPTIEDDGVVLWESMAINLYLAKKHARGSLYPIRFEDEAKTWQWSFWGMTEIERPVLTALFHRAMLPEDKRDAALADESERQLAAPLRVLDAAVAHQPYLLGEHFTVADLNVASILSWARPARIDLGGVPKMADWFKRCAERPAARAARDLQR